MVYKLEKIKDSLHYNLYFGKAVGIYTDKIYTIQFNDAITLISHRKTQEDFKDQDVSLKEYLDQFYKNWIEIKNENS